jgi:predicted kinase
VTELVITRGLPASGKTTHARAWVNDGDKRARLNRDDLRAQLFQVQGIGNREQEDAVTAVQHAAATALIKSGWSVIVDDTNLRLRYANAWATLADDLGAAFRVVEVDTPVDVCVERDKLRHTTLTRGRMVGERVIRDLNQRFRARPEVQPVPKVEVTGEPYTPPNTGRRALIVDIDGTLAHMNGRGPYDDHLVHTDQLDPVVDGIIDTYRALGYHVLLVSGRSEDCRAVTEAWLEDNLVMHERLWMRASGDNRNDAIVKRELFDKHIRHDYDVHFVLDDRNRVVDMWRGLGLKCLQVQPGDF